MAKIVRTKKVRRINWYGMVTLMFSLTFVVFLFTSIFVRAENARLTREIEKTNILLSEQRDKNDDLAREINALGDYATIIEKAEQAGLHYIAGNSYFVKLGD